MQQRRVPNPQAIGGSSNPRREPESIPVHLRLFLRETRAERFATSSPFDARLSSVSYGIAVDDVVKVSASFEAYGRINWSNLQMGVYLGDNGHIELKRDQTDPTAPSLFAEITPEDINVARRSFSVEEAYLSFITGDRVEITTVGSDVDDTSTRPDLNFIADWNDPSITRYANVDAVGRFRLYDSFDGAINGNIAGAVELIEPSEGQTIRLRSAGGAKLVALPKSLTFPSPLHAPTSTPLSYRSSC